MLSVFNGFRCTLLLLILSLIGAKSLRADNSNSSWSECQISKRGKITLFYYNSDNFISDASGRLMGIEYDLMNEFTRFVASTYGIKLSLDFVKSESFASLYDEVKNGNTGIFGACSFSITDARKLEVGFSPKYMSDIEVLICSKNIPIATDTLEFIKFFSKAVALSVANTTFDQNIKALQEIIPISKIEYEPYASNIRKRISKEQNLFSYVELPTYFASIKEGVQLKRQLMFKVERSGYGLIYPLNSDWNQPINAFFESDAFKPFMNDLIHKYFGEDVQDLLWNIGQDNSLKGKEITLLTKERDIQDLVLTKKELELKTKNILVIAFVIGFLLVIVLAFVIWKGYNSKKIANVVLRQQKVEIEHKNTELEKKKDVIEKMNDALNLALDGLSLKNKEVTDSINYSKRIQQAILPSVDLIGKNLSESFVLFVPKAIVSGDFYWYYEPDETKKVFLLATADCTGHGVPGAFMSLIGSSLLNEIVVEKKITQPDLVLNDLRSSIIKALNPKGGNEDAKDGIDLVLFKFDLDNMVLEYASAFNKFYIVRNGKLTDYVADKFPVGKYAELENPFTLRKVDLNVGDRIYSFSDGYADQFGGPNGKKFKYKKLQELLLDIYHKPMTEQKLILNETMNSWKGDNEQVDDICIIGIKI